MELKDRIEEEDFKLLSVSKKDSGDLDDLYSEYYQQKRDIRKTQIGKIQKDKTIKDGNGNSKVVEAIRIPASFQKKIVETSVAFEFGEPVSLIPSEDNDLTNEVKRVWERNRIDSKIQKIKVDQKALTQSCLIFYMKKSNDELQIKSKILTHKNGSFWPYYDELGDMKLFLWEFKIGETKHLWVFEEKYIKKYIYKKDWTLQEQELHGFDKIPVVYFSQDQCEYEDVKEIIDRLETSVSKLGASNNYSGSPILFAIGKVEGMPDRDSEGKMITAPMDVQDGKAFHGDVKFLTHDNAPDSVRLEQETLENWIYSLTDTPNLSFNNLKGIGNVSGVALELMFMGSILKAKLREGDNRTDIQRIINVIISGITTSTNIGYKSMSKDVVYDVKFGNILPNDLGSKVDTLVNAVNGKILSIEKAVELLALNEDNDEELKRIFKDSVTDGETTTE